jgi:hypothetical protein
MNRTRLYSPDWLDAEAAAYCLSLPVSTFREYVERGIFPPPLKVAKHALWSRAALNSSLEALANPGKAAALSEALRGIGHGQKEKGGRHVA